MSPVSTMSAKNRLIAWCGKRRDDSWQRAWGEWCPTKPTSTLTFYCCTSAQNKLKREQDVRVRSSLSPAATPRCRARAWPPRPGDKTLGG